MAFNFPNSPTTGQVYGNYTWDGEKWTSGTGYGAIYVSDSAPAAPVGSLWYESDTGLLFLRYQDVDSAQWVSIPGGYADSIRYSAQTLTVTQQAQARDNIGVQKKNYIINGAMMVSQENGATAVTANASYPVDAWTLGLSLSGGAISVGQVAKRTPAGAPNRIRCTVTAAQAAIGSSYVFLQNRLEGLKVADLLFGTASAKTVTLRFGICAPAGAYTVALCDPAGAVIVYQTVTVAAGEANVDVVKSSTFAGITTGTWPTDNTLGMMPMIYPAVAANSTPFMATNGNVFELFDVSLTEGSVAPPFIMPDYPSELALCQRYFEMVNVPVLQCPAIGSMIVPYCFKRTMRAAPTGTTVVVPTYSNANSAVINSTTTDAVALQFNATVAGGYLSGWKFKLDARM